jgi:EAL domain-containing protein (putative c-di-GMP-specific phosphodiesterase class I)
MYPLDGHTSEELTRKADQAMYAAKQTGKNQFNYFTREMDDRAHLRLKLTNDLHSALLLNQFEVHYQPVVDLHSGRITKAEALLRWRHPVLGKVEPSLFIPLAEESGLIRTIGNWVFREAAWFSKRCSEHLGMPFQISVNKSPMQFMSREVDDNWLDYMLNLGLPANSICVEITEGALLNASPRVTDRLLEFRDAGIQVALDDFGTGYSSMAYLQKFDIDYLKIDRSFVTNILTDRDSRTIAETIIVMAHKLEKKVVAEGIETPGQLSCLMQAGCDYGQGFLFSPAVPIDTFLELLTMPIDLPPLPAQRFIVKP